MTTVVRVCEATYDANLVAKEGIQVLVSPVKCAITGTTGKSSAMNYATVDIKSVMAFAFCDVKNGNHDDSCQIAAYELK